MATLNGTVKRLAVGLSTRRPVRRRTARPVAEHQFDRAGKGLSGWRALDRQHFQALVAPPPVDNRPGGRSKSS